jgi:hypothetical protein
MCWAYHNPLESFKSVRRKATQDGRKAHPSLVSSSPNFQSQSSNEKCHSNPVEEGATKRLSRNFKSVKVMKDKERLSKEHLQIRGLRKSDQVINITQLALFC